jgi:general nucleoside transport system permease protein
MEPFLIASVKMAAPLLLAATGELVAQRSGVINIGIEGIMLCAALGGMMGAFFGGSPWAGLALGLGVGLCVAAVFALLAVVIQADQIVTGMGINILALGATGALYRGVFGETGAALTVPTFGNHPVPLLGGIPLLGPAFFRQDVLVYLGLLLVPLVWLFLRRTYIGLALRAAGEHPAAADTAGVSVAVVRFAAVMAGGLLAAAGGCYLSLAHANTFTEGMSAGRGFIALSIVIFGRWSPWGVLAGALVFGAAGAAQFQLQAHGLGIPHQFLLMLPYVAALVVLAGVAGGVRGPAALAKPYQRG